MLLLYICNIYFYSVLDEQYTPWVLLAVISNAKCLDHVDTNKTGQKFTVTEAASLPVIVLVADH